MTHTRTHAGRGRGISGRRRRTTTAAVLTAKHREPPKEDVVLPKQIELPLHAPERFSPPHLSPPRARCVSLHACLGRTILAHHLLKL